MPGGSNKLISAMETADRLGVHHDTLYRKWEEWGLKAVRFGRNIKFREREVDAWLDRQTVGD